MNYISTRGSKEKLSAAQAIIAGIAADGGLFVPDELPQVDLAFIESLTELSYEQRAVKILEKFLTDYSEAELQGCVERAYGKDKFDTKEIAPVTALPGESVLELWHGPTSAFKDMALQLLPQLMSTALRKTGEKSDIVILVATSGDTGKAALEGFKDVEQIRIIVFYPESGVSKIQRLQMITQTGGNVAVVAVEGNFDDAQTGVKQIFGDKKFKDQLKDNNVQLSSANSINWGRLVPQIVYYFSSYADLLKKKKISLGDEINFCVPTGNFGNILAGYYAKQMGLPVHKLVCASNANNVLTDFLKTGIYNRNRGFFKTITPSMDILISSNLERLLYHVTGGDTNQIFSWMEDLKQSGVYDVGAKHLAAIQKIFWAGWTDDQRTQSKIASVYKEQKYVMDTHTAVAWQVADEYRQTTGDLHEMVIVSTASPYKFNESVLEALGVAAAGMDEFALLEELAKYNTLQAPPAALTSLRTAEIRHKELCAVAQMPNIVTSLINK
ncbi:MAG: threonine synthase [Selenomonadaceae bacterium]